MGKFAALKRHIAQLKAESLYRELKTVSSRQGPSVQFEGADAKKILFSSNNYLNLASHPAIAKAASDAIEQFGLGAAASRLISGTMTPHRQLENAFAKFLHKRSALYMPSGWTANEALLTTIPQKGDLILIDKFDHASIIDAARASGARFRTYRRNETDKLEKYLTDTRYNTRFIVTESVFSMDGDTADLAALVELKDRHNAVLILDEAHSVGCLGPTGAGLAEQLDLLEEIDIIVAPLGKAFAAQGAIIAAEQVVIDYLINKARAFIYTTAPAPPICAAAEKALEIVQTQPERRVKLAENAQYLRTSLKDAGFDIANTTTHIIPLLLGKSKDAMFASAQLYDRGFFVPAIRPPTVPKGSARLRISVQCDHTKAQLDGLIDALKDICSKLNIND